LKEALQPDRRFLFIEWPQPQARIASQLNDAGATGIIAEYTAELLDWIPALPQRTVLILADVLTDGCACVAIDDWAVGQSAAAYLYKKDLREFAYIGSDGLASVLRGGAFKEHLRSSGRRVHELKLSMETLLHSKGRRTALDRWVSKLPKPVGIFTESADFALAASDACFRMGIGIPNEVALLSGEDDPALELGRPGISCIQLPWEEIARTSLAELESMKRQFPTNPILIPPSGIRTRGSTDTFHTHHESLQRVLRHMQSHFTAPISIADIARSCGINRRLMERLFQKELDASPKAVLTQMRTHYASDLLLNTQKPVAEIAELAGFSNSAQLCAACKKAFGKTPRAYRHAQRHPNTP
jgi:LacI family transcriptional regulator